MGLNIFDKANTDSEDDSTPGYLDDLYQETAAEKEEISKKQISEADGGSTTDKQEQSPDLADSDGEPDNSQNNEEISDKEELLKDEDDQKPFVDVNEISAFEEKLAKIIKSKPAQAKRISKIIVRISKKSSKHFYVLVLRTLISTKTALIAKRKLVAGGVVVIFITAGVLSSISYFKAQSAKIEELPDGLVLGAQTSVYYPDKLPEDYYFDPNNTAVTETLTAYTLTDSKTKITISKQKDIPWNAFISLFVGAKEVQTKHGKAFVMEQENKTKLAGIRTDDSSVLITADKPIDTTVMVEFIDSLSKRTSE